MENPKEIAGRFVLGAEIASRSACVVYRGTDRTLDDREVAVKIFKDRPDGNSEAVKAFEDEVGALRGASHPTLVPILSGGYENDVLYLALEFIPGKSLKDMLKDYPSGVDVEQTLSIVTQLSEGLHEIHELKVGERQLFHGHLDSRAILFKGDEPRLAGYHPAIIDELQRQTTSVARVIADAAYISPEQLSGAEKVDGRADIYSLAVLLFEMLTGQRPFTAANPLQAAMLRMSQAAPSPMKLNSNISPLLDATILKALSRDPKDRFQSMIEFRDALTGGKRPVKNPLAEVLQQSGSDRMTTETIAVSMSTEALKSLLRAQDAVKSDAGVTGTTSAKALGADVGPEVARTMVGMQVKDLVKASLMALNGPKKGERFQLSKLQNMVGSDSGCDICFSGKSIPARYALVVQRGEEYFVAPLSPSPLVVNDQTVKGSEEIPLKRGDVLNVGEFKLRFIAPGEVFTLKDEIADRVVDRPKSKLPTVLLVATVAIGVFVLGGLYLWSESINQQQSKAKLLEARKAQERDELVKKLIREGDEFFRSGAFHEPVGANAEEKFRYVLELDPDNSYAKRRIQEIEERETALKKDKERKEQFAQRLMELGGDAERYFQAKQYVVPPGKNAKETYQEILRLDPSNQTAKARIQEIDQLMGDLLSRLTAILSQARAQKEGGNYVEPPGLSAHDLLKQVLSLDPNNAEAKEMISDMAARSLFAGEVAKKSRKARNARRALLTAQALGVDPACIQVKMKGIELIDVSTGQMVIVSGKEDCPKSNPPYLDSADLDKRLANLRLQSELKGKSGQSGYLEFK